MCGRQLPLTHFDMLRMVDRVAHGAPPGAMAHTGHGVPARKHGPWPVPPRAARRTLVGDGLKNFAHVFYISFLWRDPSPRMTDKVLLSENHHVESSPRCVQDMRVMTLILDAVDEIVIAENAGDMARRLIELLDDEPDHDTLTYLAAAVLGCDVLDIVITRTNKKQ